MEVKCRGYYKRHKDSYTFMSTFQYSLINTSWLYDRDGILKAPANIFQEDLSEEYNFNPDLFNFLSIKPKAKSIIELGGTEQQQLETGSNNKLKNCDYIGPFNCTVISLYYNSDY